ncbi:MAG: D-glycero-beta-D-manno-heptose 1-phosphate adenylyltransferase [Bacteroidota bacterium]
MSKIETIRKKILGPHELMIQLDAWRKQDFKIVFTNGCFDILHLGHADYLARAAALGDILVVGLNADTSITRLKGPGRPICDQSSRSFVLASLAVVDGVVLFDEDTPEKLIESVKPDFLVKGGDYKPAEIVGSKFVESYGGSVVCIPLVEGYSTSSIEARIRHNQTK